MKDNKMRESTESHWWMLQTENQRVVLAEGLWQRVMSLQDYTIRDCIQWILMFDLQGNKCCLWTGRAHKPAFIHYKHVPYQMSPASPMRRISTLGLDSWALHYSLYCIIYNSSRSITSEYPLGYLSNLFVHLVHYQPQMCAEVAFDLF